MQVAISTGPMDRERGILLQLQETVAGLAIECIESLFRSVWSRGQPWTVVNRLADSTKRDHTVTLGGSNAECKSLLAVSSGTRPLEALLGTGSDSEMAADALGEFANNLAGMIMGAPAMREAFGPFTQSLPLYSSGQSWYPRAWGIQGCVHRGDLEMYVGYALRCIPPVS